MNTIKGIVSLIGAIALVASVTGCAGKQSGTDREVIPVSTIDDSNPGARLILGSTYLVGRVALINPRLRQVGKLTEAEVTVQNLTWSTHSLEYQFQWTDAQGFTVDNPRAWHRFTLTPNQVQSFKSTGKKPEAIKIVFTVRPVQDAFRK